MALVFKDRVQETSSTIGTGTLTLAGAVSGFQTFSSAIGNTNTTYYAIVNDSEWEVGLGTVSAGQLSRDTVLESSNANALVNFSAGTKYVFCTYAADKTVIQDASNKVSGYAIENSTIGATTASTGKFTSVTTPSVTATTTDLTLSAISTGAVKFNTLGGLQAQVSNTASAVNYVQVSGGATGQSNLSLRPRVQTQGSDATIGLTIDTKGSGAVDFTTNSNNASSFRVFLQDSPANYLQVRGSSTTIVPSLSSQGSDTNISMAFQPKGTGAINLAAGSSGVNISNGGTVTAITKTVNGTAYTSFPSIAISAPTTAGGVQAVGSISNMILNNFPTAVASGGTGYTVGNVLTIVGGTPLSVAGTLTVTSVSGGVITGVGSSNFAKYTALPTNPVSVTGGTGTGATITASWVVGDLAIATAGSGYIEQPTITFSGGGGSGASAYATVGSGTTITTLASPLTLQTPSLNTSNTVFQVRDDATVGASQTLFYMIGASSALGRGALRCSKAFYIASGSTNVLALQTGSGISTEGITQFQVNHTASAVNYVQVTGAATTSFPIISAQGSDTNISLQMYAKGTGAINFWTNNGGSRQFQIAHTTGTVVNYATATGSATGAAPAFSVAGTDTNIDLALTPKGTGNVRFGTYTGTILTPTGYIEVKDSGGTVRRLLVG